MIPCNYKLVSFFDKLLDSLFKNYTRSGQKTLFNFKSVKSSLQPHSLWITLYKQYTKLSKKSIKTANTTNLHLMVENGFESYGLVNFKFSLQFTVVC